MIRGRTTDDGAVEFYDSVTGNVVFAIDADGVVGDSVTWDNVTGKPATFPPTIGTTATTAKAGDYQPTAANISDATAVGRSVLTAADAAAARTAVGAGTSSLALGTTASTAAAGNHTHPGLTADQAAGTGSVRTLGTGATQAAAGNHSHSGLMSGSASAMADSTATDVPGLVTDFNNLLAALRTRGVISGA
ncbi:head fiber protein [Streptomyces sp. ZSW22]|uniref:head fiber protein n=1 Tax=Streptomyces sp. ZSW22 TaxID=3055050 RepID=UPI0025B128C2|nr:head fiber protein [Streptomyces sp. ZSW22]MDN3244157.1 head fiber protein [Streptomyces sp. ZSW22]